MTRIMIGIASGLVLVTVPLHLADIAPKRYSRLFGTLHQMSIGLGMIVAQSLSIPFARLSAWRYVLLVGEALAISLLISGIILGRTKPKQEPEEGRRLLQEESKSVQLRQGFLTV
jgi:MFS family permease